MPVFVTGGTGFVGINLIRSLVSDGHQVRALVRPTSRRVGLDPEKVEFVHGDVTDADSIRRGMEGCDQVYHLAGWVQFTPWGAETARRVNVGGTENVCRAAMESGVRRLVHTSSIAAVGRGPTDAPATEDTPWNLGGLRAPYYRTKHEAEQVVQRYAGRGLDAVVVNPGYIVGPYDIKPTGGRLLIRIVTRRVPGYPARGGVGFVDVREVVEGMRLAMERGVRGERYVLVGENMTYRAYVRLVARVGGVEPPKWAASYWMLYPLAVGATVLGGVRPRAFADFNMTVLRTGFCEHYVSSAKARRSLGVKCWPIEKAVSDALNWFKQNGYVQRTSDGWRVPQRAN
ncbi:MAG: SDR family oxidoreductase [Phycisphaerae bacterium]